MAASSPVTAAFIDRDGVINRDHGHVHREEDFELLPGALEGLRLLQDAGFALVVVTNQAGIAKGMYDEARLRALHGHMERMLEQAGVHLERIYHCPHHPQATVPAYRCACKCRKPRPGMLLRAEADLGIAMQRSVLVGDKRSDIEAGRAAGVALCLLVRSGHPVSDDDIASADACLSDLAAAARWITSSHRERGSS